MMNMVRVLPSALLASSVLAYDSLLGFNSAPEIENRTLDEIYDAAVAEGGIVTLWHGGDETNQQESLKKAFEARFPKMTLNVTVDLSKYHDVNLDAQLAANNVYTDSIILQTLHDYPRWDEEGALLHYAPAGLDTVFPAFKDVRAAWYGVYVFNWSNLWNTKKLAGVEGPKEWEDWLKPEFKDKIVLTYPNDDDAVLFAFDLIMQQYGYAWFESLLAQNPRWVRGTQTPQTIIGQPNSTYAATFTSGSLQPYDSTNVSLPSNGQFVSWPQTGAILKDAPHPEGAKLLHNFILSNEYQNATGLWSVRTDVPAPTGYPGVMEMSGTNPAEFARFMADRGRVERLKTFFEARIGTAQGLSPLKDNI